MANGCTEANLRNPDAIQAWQVFDTTDYAFCVVEVLYHHDRPFDCRFVAANRCFEEQSGLVDPTGRSIRDLRPMSEDSWVGLCGRVASTGEPARFRWICAQRQGHCSDNFAFRVGTSEQNLVAVLFPQESPREPGVRASAQVQKQMQLRLDAAIAELASASDALRESERWKQEFLAILENELRNPLAPIKNIVEIVKRNPRLELAMGNLGVILERQVNQLVRLVKDLPDASRATTAGRRFEVILPLADFDAVQPVVSDTGAHPCDGGRRASRLLIVDDQSDSQTAIMLLALSDYRIHLVSDAEDAVRVAKDLRPDVILIDINVAHAGHAACAAIRALPWSHHAVVLGMGCSGEKEARRSATEAGFDDYLVRPVDGAMLLSAVMTARAARAGRRADAR